MNCTSEPRDSNSQPSAARLLPSIQTDAAVHYNDTQDADAQEDETSNQVNSEETLTPDPPILVERVDDDSPDLWSTAYREAVESLGKDIDIAILKGRNVEQLFRELGEIDNEATQESAFLRGVRYLQSIQVPLERFKLALDFANPLTSIDPAVSTVFGMIRGVTAVSSTPNHPVTSSDRYSHRSPSASQLPTYSSRNRLRKC